MNRVLKKWMKVDIWMDVEDNDLRFRVKFLGIQILRVRITKMDHNIIHVNK